MPLASRPSSHLPEPSAPTTDGKGEAAARDAVGGAVTGAVTRAVLGGVSGEVGGVVRGTFLGALTGTLAAAWAAAALLLAVSADASQQAAQQVTMAERQRAEPERKPQPQPREQLMQFSADPLSGQQWWLAAAGGSNAQVLEARLRGVPGFVGAWRTVAATAAAPSPASGGHAGPVVAVLDTGITPHPDLAGQVLPGYDFVSETLFANDGDGRDADASDPGDWVSAADRLDPRLAQCAEQRSSWHGTIIAGLIAAVPDNAQGVAGINGRARILPVRVAGKCGAAVADIVDGLRWAAGLPVAGVPINPYPARIVNISFGGATACSREYQAAIDELRTHHVVVVASAGNGSGAVARPANCQGVLGVAALNRDGFKAHYSNFGAALASFGVATVGGDDAPQGAWRPWLSDGGLVTVWNNGAQQPGAAEYARLSGTSFAAPLVAGTLSLMLSVNPALNAEQLLTGVRLTARTHVTSSLMPICSAANPGRCICNTQSCGAGILDAEQALRYAAYPRSYVAPVQQVAVLDTAELRQALSSGPDWQAPASTQALASGQDTQSSASGAPSGAGGGAMSWWWVLLLGTTTLLLRHR